MKRGYKQYSLLAILLIAILVISGIPVNAAKKTNKTIDDCKKEYAEARARGDAEGMKKANEISVILMD